MRVDQEYLKNLLNVFLDSERYYTELSEFQSAGFDILSDAFLFHFQILEDQGFVESCVENRQLGYQVSGDGQARWQSNIIRLTAPGHDFAESLNRVEIFEIMSNEFKNASVSTLSNVAKQLMLGFARKQVEKYFDPGT
jgi:predicted transcriptional regulator